MTETAKRNFLRDMGSGSTFLWIVYGIRGKGLSITDLIIPVFISIVAVNFACWIGLRIRRNILRERSAKAGRVARP